MIDTFKVISVTPSGRRAHLKILISYLLRHRGLIDEHHFWLNTEDPGDIAFIMQQCAEHPDFFKVIPCPVSVSGIQSVSSFYSAIYCQKRTIFLKLDDDICYIHRDAIQSLLTFRIRNPQYFLVFANIVNNAIIDHIRQRNGLIRNAPFVCSYDCLGNGWADPSFAYAVHKSFLIDIADGCVDRHKAIFERHILHFHERVSINFICWFGDDFEAVVGKFHCEDEHFLCCVAPAMVRKPNVICGSAVVAHFAFFTQRNFLNKTRILKRYARLAGVELDPSVR